MFAFRILGNVCDQRWKTCHLLSSGVRRVGGGLLVCRKHGQPGRFGQPSASRSLRTSGSRASSLTRGLSRGGCHRLHVSTPPGPCTTSSGVVRKTGSTCHFRHEMGACICTRPRSAHGVSLVPRPLALLGVLEGLDHQSTQQALGSSGIHLRALVEGVLRKAQTVLPTEGQHRQRPDPHGPSSPQQGRVWPEVYAHPHSDRSPRRHPSHPVFSQWPSEEGRVAWGTCGGRNTQRVCLIDEIGLLPGRGWGRPQRPPWGRFC